MQRCAVSSQWLNERISLSRYAHVMFLFLNENPSTDVHLKTSLNNMPKLVGAGTIRKF